jgi:hypothetical protein
MAEILLKVVLHTITLTLFKEGAFINVGLFHSARLELPASPRLERNYFNDVNDFDITTLPTNCTNEYCSAWDIYHPTT